MLNWSLLNVPTLMSFSAVALSAEANLLLGQPANIGNDGDNSVTKDSEIGSGWVKHPTFEKRQSSTTVSAASDGLPSSVPSTSIALIILYSVTGIVTALFLLIIVTGAVRAHRNPERYGPRAIAHFGRPRQSRAKGLARAVLDAIPIVRFGASAPAVEVEKPADLEMQDRASTLGPDRPPSTDNNERTVTETVGSTPTPPPPQPPPTTTTTTTPFNRGDSDIDEPPTLVTSATTEASTSQNQCPVCMDDFEQGQEVRVLPCQHNFHPDCIDPWLLNVSGSCPLCRIDLHPEGQVEETSELPPQPPAHDPESWLRRYLDVVQSTNDEERIAALRQLHEEARARNRARRNRMLEFGVSRLSRAISGRTHPET